MSHMSNTFKSHLAGEIKRIKNPQMHQQMANGVALKWNKLFELQTN